MGRKVTAGLLIGALFLAQLIIGSFSHATAAATVKDNQNLQAVVTGNFEFAMELYKKISNSGANNNIFFSPFSISTALSMTYAGARGNTAQQMVDTMHFRLSQTDLHPAFGALSDALKTDNQGYLLEVANALWGQEGYTFQSDFLTLIQKYYNGGFNMVDFAGQTEASRGIINRWVEQNTNNKIKDLLAKGSLTPLTRLVLTNAIYFKGDWATKFKPEDTKTAPFHVRPDETVEVPMMHQSGSFRYAEIDGVKVLEMPYVGGALSMVVVLPKTALAEFDQTLDPNRLNEWLAKATERDIDITLPKFKFEAEYQLRDILSGMGMVDAFDVMSADLSGISGKKDLYITKVIHKAVIEVNEEGSEAAAATAVIIGVKAVPFKPEFKVDRPFLFFIRHNATGSILFLGRVMNPKYKESATGM
ncbi:MAG: serpin family protein [Negativicutes bacterium]|nr:serpin family protein [Negativicutes bacterium]